MVRNIWARELAEGDHIVDRGDGRSGRPAHVQRITGDHVTLVLRGTYTDDQGGEFFTVVSPHSLVAYDDRSEP